MSNCCVRDNWVSIAGYRILDVRAADLIDELLESTEQGKQRCLFFANSNFIVQCRPIRAAMHGDEFMVVNDGIGMDIASLLIRRHKFKENLNGTDFVPLFLRSIRRPLKIFLLGGTTDSVTGAALHLSRQYPHQIVGVCDGFAGMTDQGRLLSAINDARPDVLLVALGNPRQEEWIVANRGNCNASVLIGVGALFDFVSGQQRRAPTVVRRLRLEWLFRLANEPTRLLRRYSIDFLHFLYLCFRH
jgi:beta-1,4-glucosyltransferase